jgi:hypothetical protein
MSRRLDPQDHVPRGPSEPTNDRQPHHNASMRVTIGGDTNARSADCAEGNIRQCDDRPEQQLHDIASNRTWSKQPSRRSSSDGLKGTGTWITDGDVPGPPYEKSPCELTNVTSPDWTATSKKGTIIGGPKFSSYHDAPFAPYNLPPGTMVGSLAGIPFACSDVSGAGLQMIP